MINENSYFISINRILTTGLAALIGASLWAGCYYLFLYLEIITPLTSNLIPFLNFIILAVGAYIGGLVYCVLDNYFCKLLEKNKYTQLGQNFLEYASYNLVALISIIILGFIVYTKSENAGTWMLIAQTVFSLFSASLIREKNIRTNHLPTGLGLLIGTPLAVFLISFTYPQSYALATIVGIFSVVLVAMATKTVEEAFSLIEQSSKTVESSNEEI